MIVQLVVRNQGQAGKRVRVNSPFFVIGRDESCDMRTKSRSVSRKHCVIVQKEDRVYIKDLDSRNGTILNDEKIATGSGVRIYHRDKLQIGKLSFRLSVRDPDTELPDLRPVQDESTTELSRSDTENFLTNTKFRSLKQDPLPKGSSADHGEETTMSTMEIKAEDLDAFSKPESNAESNDVPTDEIPETTADKLRIDDADDEKGPKRLPEHLKPKGSADSKAAADQALRRFFSGR